MRLLLAQLFEIRRGEKIHRQQQVMRRIVAEPRAPRIGLGQLAPAHPIPHAVMPVEGAWPHGQSRQLPCRRGAVPRQNQPHLPGQRRAHRIGQHHGITARRQSAHIDGHSERSRCSSSRKTEYSAARSARSRPADTHRAVGNGRPSPAALPVPPLRACHPTAMLPAGSRAACSADIILRQNRICQAAGNGRRAHRDRATPVRPARCSSLPGWPTAPAATQPPLKPLNCKRIPANFLAPLESSFERLTDHC